jgi:PPIC-type PPIASE domain
MRRLIREPLLHFFVLGAALFVLYAWLNRGVLDTRSEIFVSRGQVSSLKQQFERIWQRPATSEELQHLVDNWVREEIFYREGMAMGLDRDDPVVRRRVGQKVEFIIEGATPATPTAAELQAWLDAHSADYVIEPRYSLRQVYFDPQRHGADLERDIASARRDLAGGAPNAGDATLLPFEMQDAPQFEVERAFGTGFASALKDLPMDSWQGPVQSSFGLHLVQLSEKSAGHAPSLEQVRAEVERDLLKARTEQANAAIYDKLRANYRVRVETADAPTKPAG